MQNKKGEFFALLVCKTLRSRFLRRLQVFGFEHIPYRHADVFLKTLAEMVTADRQVDNVGEVSGAAEESPEKELPVITASFLNDAHIPHRAEEAENLVHVRTSFYFQLRRAVLLYESNDPLVIFLWRVDVPENVPVAFHQDFHLHFGNKVHGVDRQQAPYGRATTSC